MVKIKTTGSDHAEKEKRLEFVVVVVVVAP